MITHKPHPPRFAETLVSWSLPESDREAMLGDLQEEFVQKAARSGMRAASSWYVWQTFASIGANCTRRIARGRWRRPHEESASDRTMRRSIRRIGLWLLGVPLALGALVSNSSLREDISLVIVVGVICGSLGLSLFVGSLFPKRLIGAPTQRRLKLFNWLAFFSTFFFFILNPTYPRLLRGLNRLELLTIIAIVLWPKRWWPLATQLQSFEETSTS